MGRSKFGRLGLQEEELDEDFAIPQEIKYNLPDNSGNNKVIDIRCGQTHSLAVTKWGDLYTWGEGEF